MTRAREWTLLALVAVAAAATGYAYNAWKSGPAGEGSREPAVSIAGSIPDLDGKMQALEQWRGKVLVVNFWATWCVPCREEIPIFMRLQSKYGSRGLQFVGIAIDQPDKVRPYAAELGMNFPVLIGGVEALQFARQLGNRASVLPYTVVIDRGGKVVHREIGAVKEAKIEPFLASLL